jgi:HAD superfamily hydrolase (TIGR01544 family)
VEACLSDEERARTAAMNAKFVPIEVSHELTPEQKTPYMIQWWDEAHGVFLGAGITRSRLAGAIAAARVRLRPGARELLSLCASTGIPVAVFSAGMGNVVEGVLTRELGGPLPPNMHIVANWMRFGAGPEGRLERFSEPLIHVYNKNESHLRGCPVYAQLQARPHALLLGDSTGDATMGDGLPHAAVLKVGILNAAAPGAAEVAAHAAVFDALLVERDPPLHAVVALLREIIDGGAGPGSGEGGRDGRGGAATRAVAAGAIAPAAAAEQPTGRVAAEGGDVCTSGGLPSREE